MLNERNQGGFGPFGTTNQTTLQTKCKRAAYWRSRDESDCSRWDFSCDDRSGFEQSNRPRPGAVPARNQAFSSWAVERPGPKPTLRPLGLASRWQRQSSTLCALCSFKEKSGAQKLDTKAFFPFHADSKRFGVSFCFCCLGWELAATLSTFHIDLLSM